MKWEAVSFWREKMLWLTILLGSMGLKLWLTILLGSMGLMYGLS